MHLQTCKTSIKEAKILHITSLFSKKQNHLEIFMYK